MATAEATWRRFAIPDVFTPAECARLRATSGPFVSAQVQVEGDGAGTEGARTATGVQLPHGRSTDWIVDRIHPHVLGLNRLYRFDISGYGAPQLLRYTVGQHYAWHVDMGQDDIATRKLSVIVLLSPSDDYDGGDLEFVPDLGPCGRGEGTLVVFPSFMPHRVTPVTRGERFSLVTWVHGDRPFR